MAPIMVSVHKYVHGRVATREITASTAVHQRNVLRGFALAMGNRQPSQIGASDIERWMGKQAHLAPGTARNRYAIVKCYLEWLVDEEVLRRNPMRRMRAPKVPKSRHRALDHKQVAAILNACPDAMALAYTLLGLQCGLRVSEVAGIEVGDLNWTTRQVTVLGKGGHHRTVPVPDEAWSAVVDYLRVQPCNGGPLFRLRRFPTQPASAQWIGEDFVAICWDAGVKQTPRDGVSFHALRHTAATDIYVGCRDVKAVQRILGHRSLKTTDVYVQDLDVSELAPVMEGRKYRTPYEHMDVPVVAADPPQAA